MLEFFVCFFIIHMTLGNSNHPSRLNFCISKTGRHILALPKATNSVAMQPSYPPPTLFLDNILVIFFGKITCHFGGTAS